MCNGVANVFTLNSKGRRLFGRLRHLFAMAHVRALVLLSSNSTNLGPNINQIYWKIQASMNKLFSPHA